MIMTSLVLDLYWCHYDITMMYVWRTMTQMMSLWHHTDTPSTMTSRWRRYDVVVLVFHIRVLVWPSLVFKKLISQRANLRFDLLYTTVILQPIERSPLSHTCVEPSSLVSSYSIELSKSTSSLSTLNHHVFKTSLRSLSEAYCRRTY